MTQKDAWLDPPYLVTDQIGYLLRRAYQRHLALFQANASDPQITSVQFTALCALRDGGPQSQTELVRATFIDQATIRGILERLKSRGLLSISKDLGDARKVIYSLTAQGDKILRAMIPAAMQTSEDTFGNLNPAERAALVFTLRLMITDD
jgi:MarR family transcriptional regulator, lower aerobic nicotinate degradation pathway regulator